jgi:nitric oxide reductase large subunit
MIWFVLGACRLLFEVIGIFTVALVALDEWWWTRRRRWRQLTAGLLALLMIALLQQETWRWF